MVLCKVNREPGKISGFFVALLGSTKDDVGPRHPGICGGVGANGGPGVVFGRKLAGMSVLDLSVGG